MKKIARVWKIILLDTLGVVLMILAILTGWLPGPGGIPLFLIGLGLLAINHEWARRYLETIKRYSTRLGDMVFTNNPTVQLAYDTLVPLLIICSLFLLMQHNALWQITLGILAAVIGLTVFFGNRGRYRKLKRIFKQSS